ncbi:nuclear envelope integral membrane protein 1 [Trichonephila inaurata madagascariensis]|uniref:Nuclear envelope integral membrane protein 1 n=1 Tax=Trichonephila inaurata madagascariensis TaxID=2747483 RepID=A0A8X6XSQ3_9ARAC|nr:nuclear envelope integral membrane protein 1 [Trichonephila inaurata madagascariensis]
MAVILSTGLKLCVFFLVVIIPIHSFVSSDSDESLFEKQTEAVIWLEANNKHFKQNDEQFQVFCYKSIPKTILQIWRSVELILENAPLSYDVFLGVNETDVHEKYNSKSLWHPSFWISGQKTSVDFPAFSQYCVGIAAKDKYAIFLKVRTVNYWKLLQTMLGLLLLMSAPSLSRNPFFHYTSAMSLGVLGSLLVLIYVASRFIPKKSTSYAIMIFGYSFLLYIVQLLWKDLNDIISKYMDLLLAYCVFAAFVSFIVCYRLGPIQNIRTFNIIQWSMQTIAVLLIYLSSEYREVSTAIILIIFTIRMIPSRWITKFRHVWYRLFPPKVKLITELEFIEQGHIETKKALENLRKYCSSPDCDVWKTVTRLKNPVRFAEFIDSGRHYTDQELLRYNSEDLEEQDDESDTEPLENSYLGDQRNGYHNYR